MRREIPSVKCELGPPGRFSVDMWICAIGGRSNGFHTGMIDNICMYAGSLLFSSASIRERKESLDWLDSPWQPRTDSPGDSEVLRTYA